MADAGAPAATGGPDALPVLLRDADVAIIDHTALPEAIARQCWRIVSVVREPARRDGKVSAPCHRRVRGVSSTSPDQRLGIRARAPSRIRRRGREVEGTPLLREHAAKKLHRGFESLRLRQLQFVRP